MKKAAAYLVLLLIFLHESSAQNIGIGTHVPVGKLQVNHKGTASIPSMMFLDSAAGTGSEIKFIREGVTTARNFNMNAFISSGANSASQWTFRANSSNVMTINGAGLIYFGGAVPNYFANFNVGTISNFEDAIYLGGKLGDVGQPVISNWENGPAYYDANTYFLPTGLAGLGTAAPAARLQINHKATGSLPTLSLFDSTAGTGSGLQFAKQGFSAVFTMSSDITGNTASGNTLNFKHSATNLLSIKGDGRVGIGTAAPASSALLELNSTNKGLLFPRVADTAAVSAPVKGLMIYNNANNKFWFYNGNRWQQTNSGSAGLDSIWYKTNDSTAYTLNSYVAINTDPTLSGPLANLQVNGSLLIHGEFNYTKSAPTPAQTYTMNNTGSLQPVNAADSIYRIYDPGNSGQYSNNQQGNISFFNSAVAGALVSFNSSDFGIAAGDTLWIGYKQMPDIRTDYIYRFTNTTVAPHEFAIPLSGGQLYFIFRSNGDGNNGEGFDISVKNLYEKDVWVNTSLPVGPALFFSPATSSLMSGFGNVADNTSAAFGSNSNAGGFSSFAAGQNSFASGTAAIGFGQNSVASGSNSFAAGGGNAAGNTSFSFGGISNGNGAVSIFGIANAASSFAFRGTANGSSSISFGSNSQSAGNQSIAFGTGDFGITNALALGNRSIVMGDDIRASGNNAVSIGLGTVARSYSSITLGMYNDSIATGNTTTRVATDPLLILGNGISDVNRSNALVVLKNGNTGIGISNPTAKLEVEGSVRFGTVGSDINSIIHVSAQWVAMNLPANSSVTKTFTVTGASGALNGSVSISPNFVLPDGVVIAYARVSANNTVEAKVLNTTGSAFAPGGSTFFKITVIQ